MLLICVAREVRWSQDGKEDPAEAGPRVSRIPALCAQAVGTVFGPGGSQELSKEKGLRELPSWRKKPFPLPSGLDRHAALPAPSVQSASLSPHPPACVRRLQGEMDLGVAGLVWGGSPSGLRRPQCFLSVLAPVLSWPRSPPLVPGSVLVLRSQSTQGAGPGPFRGSSRIRGVATPPGPQRGPGWFLAVFLLRLPHPASHPVCRTRGFGVFGFPFR